MCTQKEGKRDAVAARKVKRQEGANGGSEKERGPNHFPPPPRAITPYTPTGIHGHPPRD